MLQRNLFSTKSTTQCFHYVESGYRRSGENYTVLKNRTGLSMEGVLVRGSDGANVGYIRVIGKGYYNEHQKYKLHLIYCFCHGCYSTEI